MNQEFGS